LSFTALFLKAAECWLAQQITKLP